MGSGFGTQWQATTEDGRNVFMEIFCHCLRITESKQGESIHSARESSKCGEHDLEISLEIGTDKLSMERLYYLLEENGYLLDE